MSKRQTLAAEPPAPVSPGEPAEPAPARPRSLANLFWSFSAIALQGFGGVIAVVQRELVDKRGWLTPQAFVEDWATAQVMPGPNACNLAIIVGDRAFGWRGAAAALAGLICFPLLLLLSLAALYRGMAGHPAVAGALHGMSAAAAGLIAATALKMVAAMRRHPLGLPVALLLSAASCGASVLLHVPLHFIVLGLGGLACWLTWWRLGSGGAR